MKSRLQLKNELFLTGSLVAVLGLTKFAAISRVETYLWLSLAAILGASVFFALSFFGQRMLDQLSPTTSSPARF